MSNTICSYEGCYNSAFKIPGLKMFRFPRKCPETADIWIKNCGNPALKDEPIEKLYRSNRVCQRHFKESYILPSGRLMNGAIPEPFIREEEEEHLVKEEPEDCTSSSPSPEPLWRSKPAEKTYSIATTDNVEKNVQSSGNLTESSQQPIASTSTSVQPKPVVKKATTAKTSERKKIAGPTDMQVATTATSTNNETALLHEKIRQLEEINIQLQIENESYRIKNVMLETQKNKLIGKLKTIVKAKDPLALGENTLIFEQHSERLTVGPISSASNPGYPTASTATLTGDSQIDDIIGTHSQDYSDADNAGDDDDSSYLDNMGGGGGQIEIDVDVDPAFETVDIKPLIVHGEVQPQPQTTKRKRNSDPLDPSATSSKRSTPLKKKLLCDFGDEGNEDDDDEPDYGDDFDSEEDSAKVRRAYELLKSVFDKKDKYDLFCDRLAGRLRALQSPKVCRHVQQILVTAVADAEAGKFDNI